MDFKPLIEELALNRTEEAKAMSAYLRHQFQFLGLKSQRRRDISKPYLKMAKQEAKSLYKENPQADIIDWKFVKECWQQDEREFQYVAADYLRDLQNYLKKEDLAYLKIMITTKSWWDSVDALVKIVGKLAVRYPELKETLVEWSLSDNIWLKRTSIINQLGMKDQTDLLLLERTIVNNFNSKEFFINKAIGWALRDYAKSNEGWVIHFINENRDNLSTLSIREASKHLDIGKE